jgi:hypothetical protein
MISRLTNTDARFAAFTLMGWRLENMRLVFQPDAVITFGGILVERLKIFLP